MNKRAKTLLALTLLLPTAAFADNRMGPYVAAGLGPDWIQDNSIQFFNRKIKTKWTGGWGGFVAAGYKWPWSLRTEVEASGRQGQIKTFNTSPWFGMQWDTSVMANLLYDVPTGTDFTPYFGGGVGVSHISWGNNFRASRSFIYDDTDTKLGWQAIFGVAYAVTPKISLSADYRIKGSDGYRFRSSGPATTNITNFDYSTHSLFLGLRYAFD